MIRGAGISSTNCYSGIVETVKGLRREQPEQTEAIDRLAAKVGQSSGCAERRGLMVGLGWHRWAMGAITHKILEFFWPTGARY